MRAVHDSTRVTRVLRSGLWSLGLLVSALAVGGCAPPLVGSFEPKGKTPNEIAAHAAYSPEHRASLVRTILGCHAYPTGCHDGATLSDADAASIRAIVQRTSKMKSAPVFTDVPTHLPPMVLSDLLDAGLVKMPQLPSVTAGVPQRQPLDNDAWFKACNLRNGAYGGFGAAPEDFARYQVLLDHGWPVDELDLMFVMRVAPDTPAGLALVDRVYARLGNPSPNQDFTGAAIMRQHPESLLDDHNRRNLSAAGQWVRHWANPFLGAIRAGKRTIVTQLLARGTVKDAAIDQVAATGQPWALELVSRGGAQGKVTCISSQMLPNLDSLLRGGADPNARCPDGLLPLTAALRACDMRSAMTLLDKGARADLASVYWAVVAQAQQASVRKYPAPMTSQAVREHSGVMSNLVGWEYQNGTHCGATREIGGAPAILLTRMLAAGPPSLTSPTRVSFGYGDSIVHVAARANLAETVKQLVDAGAAMDSKNEREELPLDVAGPEAVAVLRGRGATGGDPVAIAENRRRRELAKREEEAQSEAARERRAERRAQEAADERATQAREQRERDDREARAQRAMPNTGVDMNASRQAALGPSQGGLKPAPSPGVAGRSAPSSPAQAAGPPPSTRTSPPARAPESARAAPPAPPARTAPAASPPPASPPRGGQADRDRELQARSEREARERADKQQREDQDRARASQQREREGEARHARCRQVEAQQKAAADRVRSCEAGCDSARAPDQKGCKSEATLGKMAACENRVRDAHASCSKACRTAPSPGTPDECVAKGTAR
jgi:hypothetical protein